MPAELPSRKRKQIKRFFGDWRKVGMLTERARGRGNLESESVFHTTIAGEERTVKVQSGEKAAKGNILLLEKDHKKAVEKGKIKAESYELSGVHYAHANRGVGVMERVPGVGADNLRKYLSFYVEKKYLFLDTLQHDTNS